MTELVIPVPQDTLEKLQAAAAKFQMTLEELVFVSIQDLLEQPEAEFLRILQYVLAKNAELCRRLA